jgi:hypothetical protein
MACYKEAMVECCRHKGKRLPLYKDEHELFFTTPFVLSTSIPNMVTQLLRQTIHMTSSII